MRNSVLRDGTRREPASRMFPASSALQHMSAFIRSCVLAVEAAEVVVRGGGTIARSTLARW